MPKRLLKSRLHPNKHKPKTKQKLKIFKSSLFSILQSFEQKLLTGKGFVHYK